MMNENVPPKLNKRLGALLVPALLSCICSSTAGLFLGQVGNVLYKLTGEAGACLAIPGFVLLFLITGSISYFGNKLIARWLKRSPK